MTAQPLPTGNPSAAGLDARGVLSLLDALESSPAIEPHSLMILRHGQLVATGWWEPYTAEHRQLLYSLSKSFASTALGLAVAEGLVGLDDQVLDYFPEFAADITDAGARDLRVRHLAAMASGHRAETWDAAVAGDPGEPVRGFLLIPPDEAPGTLFAYNQSNTYTLAAIVQRVSGQTLTDYLRPRLFDPLGIGTVGWQQQPAGRDLGFSGLHATTDAIARLGQLYLQRGVWNGRRLLPAEWVAEATRSHVSTAAEGNPDWRCGYGFQFWMSRHGYRGDGAFGQYCVVLPEHDAVIAITSATLDMQAVLDAVWAHVVPALGHAGDSVADEELAERLARLAIPTPGGSAHPPGEPDRWSRADFFPDPHARREVPTLLRVVVGEDGPAGDVTLVESDARLRLRLNPAGWSTGAPGPDTPPTAVSGGWLDADTLRFDVIFLETPHRLTITCSSSLGTFDAQWATTPLMRGGNSLSGLRMPVSGR